MPVAPLDLCLLRSSPLTTPRPVLSLVAPSSIARIKDNNDERVHNYNGVCALVNSQDQQFKDVGNIVSEHRSRFSDLKGRAVQDDKQLSMLN